jgi:protein-disulfide isomerase
MKRALPFIIVIGVGLLTVGGAGYFYKTKHPGGAPLKIGKTEKDAAGGTVHVLGPEKAAVTIEEFGDFQCPPCGRLCEPLNELQKKYNLRLVYRNYPLPMHAHAREAACAAEAAGRQGKFWEMHDLLFKEQAVWSHSNDVKALFSAYAGMLQLDLSRFRNDLDSREVIEKIDKDQARGNTIGVKTTPTLFLNDEAVSAENTNPDKLPALVENLIHNPKPSS